MCFGGGSKSSKPAAPATPTYSGADWTTTRNERFRTGMAGMPSPDTQGVGSPLATELGGTRKQMAAAGGY